MDLFSDKRFLSVIHSYERTLAKTLALLLAVVIWPCNLRIAAAIGHQVHTMADGLV